MSPVVERIKEKFGRKILETCRRHGDDTIVAERAAIRELASFLSKDADLDFNMLMDMTAVDYLARPSDPGFEVVYHFYSLSKNRRLRVKVPVPAEDACVESLTALWPIADWLEREIWDMFGVSFRGHPNLKRILMYDGFEGHPLRKSYPVRRRQPLIGPKNGEGPRFSRSE